MPQASSRRPNVPPPGASDAPASDAPEGRAAKDAHSVKDVHSVAAAFVAAEQQERARLAAALHDELQQTIFSLQLRVQILALDAALDEAHPAAASLADVQRLADKAVTQVRTLSVDLNPPSLRDDPFEASLRWLSGQIQALRDREVTVRVEDAEPGEAPSMTARVLLLGTLRELLSAPAATPAEVRLRRARETWTVEVDVGTSGPPDLENARTRLGAVGGTITLLPDATCVLLAVPTRGA